MVLAYRFKMQNSDGVDMRLYYTPTTLQESKGLVFLEHGIFSGSHTPHNMAFAQIMQEAGYDTIQVDATNSNNNSSGGNTENFTIARHTMDLKESIEWVKINKPEIMPAKLGLVGHSMGGLSVLEVAAENVDTQFVIALNPVISGAQLKAAWEGLDTWEKTGVHLERPDINGGKPGLLPWSVWNEWEQHDACSLRLNMPVLLIAASNDTVTPAKDTKEFFFSGCFGDKHKSQIVYVNNTNHRFKNPQNIVQKEPLAKAVEEFLLHL
jgi:alpha-beta hydrolase superfamily lysophospholipase